MVADFRWGWPTSVPHHGTSKAENNLTTSSRCMSSGAWLDAPPQRHAKKYHSKDLLGPNLELNGQFLTGDITKVGLRQHCRRKGTQFSTRKHQPWILKNAARTDVIKRPLAPRMTTPTTNTHTPCAGALHGVKVDRKTSLTRVNPSRHAATSNERRTDDGEQQTGVLSMEELASVNVHQVS
ncbi:hypothetical protein PISMIDRAFT_671695 [Pisolithus microcarpus 441]|uniref:Unplaced genomic scaffold scaffold_4, whole genome shotgun sequence n=1 Tax=Pisolithus microcarpus 441 TaxID=765257 RepID=A0A0C9ZK88_9AGAM|nr:hypothetical protein PISMIDRAFT_671695 [Pisolithus microcarpus 441]